MATQQLTEDEVQVASAVETLMTYLSKVEAECNDPMPIALTRLAYAHDLARGLAARTDACRELYGKRMLVQMEQGLMHSVDLGQYKLTIREQTYFGVDHTRLRDVVAFVDQWVGHDAVTPSSATVKRAMEAFMDANPGAPRPDFLTSTLARSVVNTKRK